MEGIQVEWVITALGWAVTLGFYMGRFMGVEEDVRTNTRHLDELRNEGLATRADHLGEMLHELKKENAAIYARLNQVTESLARLEEGMVVTYRRDRG